MQKHSLKYLQLLSEKYPSIQAASTAIINLSAQIQLPKGTEHFLSDVHGEHEAFGNIAENGYGALIQYGNHTVATTVYDAGANWELTEGSAPPDLYVANGMFTTDGDLPGAVKLENTFIEAVPTMGADSALILNVK